MTLKSRLVLLILILGGSGTIGLLTHLASHIIIPVLIVLSYTIGLIVGAAIDVVIHKDIYKDQFRNISMKWNISSQKALKRPAVRLCPRCRLETLYWHRGRWCCAAAACGHVEEATTRERSA